MPWEEASSNHQVSRIVIGIDGLEGSGKDHLALSGPGDIAIISLDEGLEGVVEKFLESPLGPKRILVAKHAMPVFQGMSQQESSSLATKIWKEIRSDYKDALETKGVRTIICDTGTEMWEICRMSWFGKLDQVMPHHYAKPNREWADLVRMGLVHDKNVCWLHKLKPEYVNDKNTGKYKRSGQSDMGFLVQAVVRTSKDLKENGVPDKFNVLIEKARFRPEVENMELSGEDCNFPVLASLIMFGDADHVEEFI